MSFSSKAILAYHQLRGITFFSGPSHPDNQGLAILLKELALEKYIQKLAAFEAHLPYVHSQLALLLLDPGDANTPKSG